MCKNNINELIGLIHMCYGWMPTMYKKSDTSLYKDNELIKKIWDKIKEGSLDSVFLNNLKRITNNSIIGTSKLLHFCNPKMYAIYDSKIYCCISGNTTTGNYNNVDYYISYMKKMKEWEEDKIFIKKLREILSNNNPRIVEFSDLRCIEMCFYYNN